MGKSVGDDFREAKMTLPIILAHARADETAPAVLEAGDRNRQPDRSRSHHAITLVEQTGAIQETMRRARAYADIAKAALAVLPASEITRRAGGHRRFLRRAGVLKSVDTSDASARLLALDRADALIPVGVADAATSSWTMPISGTKVGCTHQSGCCCFQHCRRPRGSCHRPGSAQSRWRRPRHAGEQRARQRARAQSAPRRSRAASARAGASRSLLVVSRKRSRSARSPKAARRQFHLHAAARSASAAKTSLVGTATPRIDQQHRQARQGCHRASGSRRVLP